MDGILKAAAIKEYIIFIIMVCLILAKIGRVAFIKVVINGKRVKGNKVFNNG